MLIRDKFGLLNPVDLNFPDFTPPDSKMAKDAEVFARETHKQDLLRTATVPTILALLSVHTAGSSTIRNCSLPPLFCTTSVLRILELFRLNNVALPSAAVVRFMTF